MVEGSGFQALVEPLERPYYTDKALIIMMPSVIGACHLNPKTKDTYA